MGSELASSTLTLEHPMAEKKKERIMKATFRAIVTTRDGKRIKIGPKDVTRKPGSRHRKSA